jgi:hypothetical protein
VLLLLHAPSEGKPLSVVVDPAHNAAEPEIEVGTGYTVTTVIA